MAKKDAMGRLEDVEKEMEKVLDSVSRAENAVGALFNVINQQLTPVKPAIENLTAAVNAIVEVVGADQVQAKLNEVAQARLAAEEQAILRNLEAGRLRKTDKVGYASIIGYREFDAAGQVRIPGKFFKTVLELNPEAQKLLIDQVPGFKSSLPTGGEFELLEIYEMTPKTAAEELAAATSPEAQVAAAAVAEMAVAANEGIAEAPQA